MLSRHQDVNAIDRAGIDTGLADEVPYRVEHRDQRMRRAVKLYRGGCGKAAGSRPRQFGAAEFAGLVSGEESAGGAKHVRVRRYPGLGEAERLDGAPHSLAGLNPDRGSRPDRGPAQATALVAGQRERLAALWRRQAGQPPEHGRRRDRADRRCRAEAFQLAGHSGAAAVNGRAQVFHDVVADDDRGQRVAAAHGALLRSDQQRGNHDRPEVRYRAEPGVAVVLAERVDTEEQPRVIGPVGLARIGPRRDPGGGVHGRSHSP